MCDNMLPLLCFIADFSKKCVQLCCKNTDVGVANVLAGTVITAKHAGYMGPEVSGLELLRCQVATPQTQPQVSVVHSQFLRLLGG